MKSRKKRPLMGSQQSLGSLCAPQHCCEPANSCWTEVEKQVEAVVHDHERPGAQYHHEHGHDGAPRHHLYHPKKFHRNGDFKPAYAKATDTTLPTE